MKQYNKLVRDKVPDALTVKKIKFTSHVANKKEYLDKLYEKFIEEFEEFKKHPCMEEYADILEVLEYIGKFHKFDLQEIKIRKKIKKESNGGFDKRIILDEAEEKK